MFLKFNSLGVSKRLLFCLNGILAIGVAAENVHAGAIQLAPIGVYETGVFDGGAAEIVTYDPATQRAFVSNADTATVDILDVSNPANPVLLSTIDATPFGAKANSVAVKGGCVAVAIENANPQQPGTLALFDTGGTFQTSVTVGALPDMVTFSPDGNTVLVANEGEPNDSYTDDPEGSVSIVDVSKGCNKVKQKDVVTAGFGAFGLGDLDSSTRIFGPDATVAQDLEPEFIAVSDDSTTAWVTLQENNAIGILDIVNGQFTDVVGLGFKDHNTLTNRFDASNKDGLIRIKKWPTLGMYQPDAIASYSVGGNTFLVTANEGDARDYGGFSEEARVKDIVLDPSAFPDRVALQKEDKLGRLKITTANGDTDGDEDFDQLFSYGARSFSILDAGGAIVFDSGEALEQITAAALPNDFNSTNDENGSFDDRSDDKGPEPEGVAIGEVGGNTYAFIGLERVGGVIVYDISDPLSPSFVQYINTRDFSGDPVAGTAGDLAPEGMVFVKASDSPNGKALLLVGYEVSGSTRIFEINEI